MTVKSVRSSVAKKATTSSSPKRRRTSAPAKAQTAASATDKPKKQKLVRDSFTMPEAEYAEIANMKKRFLARGVAVKKSELLRAAIRTLADLSDAVLIKAVRQLDPIKAGRPAKAKK